jgi:hypothetical protein
LLLATITLLVGTGFYQAREASRLRTESEALRQQQAALTDPIGRLQRETDRAANRLATVDEEIARLKSGQEMAELLKVRGEAASLRRQLAAIKAEIGSDSTGHVSMFTDPSLRGFIRQGNINRIKGEFASLFRDLKLTPDQAQAVMEKMTEVMQKRMDRMYGLPQGSLSSPQLEQAAAERAAEWKEQLEPLLGESGYARLREFEGEIPVHAAIDLLDAQLGAGPLSDEQNARLFQVIKAEPYDLIRNITGESWDPAFWGPQDYVDKHLQNIAESNQRMLEKAGSFLTPEQLTVFSTVLSNGVNARVAQAAAYIQKH